MKEKQHFNLLDAISDNQTEENMKKHSSCPECRGSGEHWVNFSNRDRIKEYCGFCKGTGINPNANIGENPRNTDD
jgi:hypothetical protein